jgi:hypothetical protein
MGLVKNYFNNYVSEYNSIFRLKVNKDIKTVIKTFNTITNFICKWFLILYESSWTVDDEDNDEYLCRDFFCWLHFSLAVVIPDIYIYIEFTEWHIFIVSNLWWNRPRRRRKPEADDSWRQMTTSASCYLKPSNIDK